MVRTTIDGLGSTVQDNVPGMTDHPASPDQVRPSDVDRQVIADRLRHAVDEGRLDLYEYDERLRNAYTAKTYGELEHVVNDLPVPPEQEGPVLVQLGEISVTSTTVYTPVGPMPLRGSQWAVMDQWVAQQKIPTWAIVVAIVGSLVVCLFSLLFLLAKETVYQGGIQVTVTNGDRQYTTRIPLYHQAQAYHLHQQVNWLRSAAAH